MTKKDHMNVKNTLGILAILISFVYQAEGQGIALKGQVLDELGEPLIGASVVLQGDETIGTITDIDGNFLLERPQSVNELKISFVGYQTLTETIGDRTFIRVSLRPDVTVIDEVVVIGYGESNKRDVIGAVGSVKSQDIESRAPSSALESIQGRVAGVQITTASGAPGAGAQIRIRGLSTFEGGENPLYVVDGQPVDDISNINPSDIESIDILKDGASAAIYGSRSANGVVIITTKRGGLGKPTFKVDYLRAYSHIIGQVPVTNSEQRLEYETLISGGTSAGTNADSLSTFFANDTDWQDVISRIGIRDRLNVSLSGGSKKAKYYVNLGHLRHKGILINSLFKRTSMKLNFDFEPNQIFKSGSSVNLSVDQFNGLDERAGLMSAIILSPNQPVYDYNGELLLAGARISPVARASLEKRETRNFRANVFQYFQIQPIPSLTLKSTFGANATYRKFELFTPNTITNDFSYGRLDNILWTDWIHEDYLTWAPDLGEDHDFNVVIGTALQYWRSERSRIDSDEGFATSLIPTLNNANAFNVNNTSSSSSEHSLASVFGRINYKLKNRYFLSATIRRDGSSRFGKDNKWGNFPAVGIGWRVSDEPFLKPINTVVSNIKLRGNYAVTGNERIPDFASRTLYRPGAFYDGASGIQLAQFGNADLSWEQTRQINLGLDLGFIEDRFTVNIDYYRKVTTDLLLNVPLPLELILENTLKNVGSVLNEGIELSLSGTIIRSNDFSWRSSFNISKNSNEVLKLEKGVPLEFNIWKVEVGKPVGNFFGYQNNGVFAYDESNAFTETGQQLTPIFDAEGSFQEYQLNGQGYNGDVTQLSNSAGTVLKGGDIIWEDLDKNGVIDQNDRKVIGNGLPDFFGGFINDFTYKNWSLSVVMDYTLGNDLYRNFDATRNAGQWFNVTPSPDAIDNAWRKQGDVTKFPALNNNARPLNKLSPNSFYVNDGSYIKLRTVRIGYRFPKALISKIGLSDASTYINVNNLLTWTNYQGYDPEQVSGRALQIGRDELQYPRQREFLMGFILSF
ncbi:MAG: TonB-dependent receptor [Cyclobacteriaceae bacterium]